MSENTQHGRATLGVQLYFPAAVSAVSGGNPRAAAGSLGFQQLILLANLGQEAPQPFLRMAPLSINSRRRLK